MSVDFVNDVHYIKFCTQLSYGDVHFTELKFCTQLSYEDVHYIELDFVHNCHMEMYTILNLILYTIVIWRCTLY